MKEKKVSIINSYGEKLIGLKTVPEVKKDKYPTVILVHGFKVTKEEDGKFDDLSKELSKADFLVYRFDFSGCGESEGNFIETSLTKLKNDLAKILEFVRQELEVDTHNIGLLGQSLGTSVIVSLAPLEVKVIILIGSVAKPKEILIDLFGKGYNPEGVSERKRGDGVTKVGPQFWQDFKNHNLLKCIKEIRSPKIFIHGELDEKVPLLEVEEYFRNANEPKEKIIIKGMNHGWEPVREKVIKIAVDRFKKYLK